MPQTVTALRGAIREYPAVLYAQKAYQILQVEAIYYKTEGDVIYLWTQVNIDQRDIRDSLYRIEENIETSFPEALFDFYIFAGDGKELSQEFTVIEPWQI